MSASESTVTITDGYDFRRHQESDRPDWERVLVGGISNPLEVIEQITYLLFLRRLDDLHTLEENKSARLEEPMARRVFPAGKDGIDSRDSIRLRLFVRSLVGLDREAAKNALGGTDVTPHGPDALFTSAQVDELIDALASVKATAVAA